MRRKDRQLSEADAWALLKLASWGVLAFEPDEDGYPHAVPINCAYVDGALLFHCAKAGKKLDILARDNRVCFAATIQHEMIPEEYTAHFESVICYGRISRLPDEEVTSALAVFATGVFKMPISEGILKKSGEGAPATAILRMEIEHITGKRSGSLNSLG